MLQDLRYALRMLRKNPGLTLVAVLSLALGIGATTTIFSWIDGLVLHPWPLVQAPGRLVQLKTLAPGGEAWGVSYPDFLDWRAQTRQVSDLSAFEIDQFGLKTAGKAERAWGVLASADYFAVMGIRPSLGRVFRPDEAATPGRAAVAVISDGFWRRKFAGDSGVVGRHLSLNGHDFTVIGVLPPKFGGTTMGLAFDVWVPVTMQPLLYRYGGDLGDRGSRGLTVMARLKPGVSAAAASADLALVQRRLAAAYPLLRGTSAAALPFGTDGPQEWLRPLLTALLGITGVVLLVACANVANLLLARATARQREMAVRLALGATRVRLARQLLLESTVLAALGGMLGLGVALWGREVFTAFVPPAPYPIELQLGVSGRVALFAVAVTVLSVLVFGSAPALRATRPDLVPALKDDAGQGLGSRSHLRSALVVGQLALSVVALVAAGLFLRSLGRTDAADRGLRDPRHVLVAGTDLFAAGYTGQTGRALVDRLLTRVRAVPGVTAASVTTFVPLGIPSRRVWGTEVEGYQPRAQEDMSIQYAAVGSDYFSTLGIPILRGRPITADDRDSAPAVAVVNEAFVRRYWPGLDPIGRRVKQGDWLTVVGVAKDGKYNKLREAPLPFVFRSYHQRYHSQPDLVVRTRGDPKALIATLQRVFAAVDPNLPFLDPRTLADHMRPATFMQRTGATLLGAFGALALVMAAIGLYGVISYLVGRRMREMGIRVALGAGRSDILGLVLGEATRLVGVGLAVGAVAALGVGRLLQSQLFGIPAYDLPTFGAILALLAAVAMVASWLPARRAAKVDPVVALRSE